MKILVTGAAGFIGSHLSERLVGNGHRVLGLDNFDPFYPRGLKEANLLNLDAHEKFDLVEMDILDTERLWDVIEDFGPDTVVHLAALAGVQPSLAAPERYARVNVTGTLNILQGLVRSGCGKLVFASSSSVYGARSRVPFDEADPCDRPVSPYAATKRCGELLCYTFHHLHSMDITCLRFFTVYGPRQRPEMAIAKFTRLVSAGEPVTLYGDGRASRDYTYVGDIIAGTAAAVERDLPGFRVYNLGNSRPVALSQLVDLIERAVGKPARRVFEPDRPGDVPTTCARVDRAAQDLDFRPEFPLEEGITRYVEWFRSSRRPEQD